MEKARSRLHPLDRQLQRQVLVARVGDAPPVHRALRERVLELHAEPGPELLGVGNGAPDARARRAQQCPLLDPIRRHAQPPGCMCRAGPVHMQPCRCASPAGARAGAPGPAGCASALARAIAALRSAVLDWPQHAPSTAGSEARPDQIRSTCAAPGPAALRLAPAPPARAARDPASPTPSTSRPAPPTPATCPRRRSRYASFLAGRSFRPGLRCSCSPNPLVMNVSSGPWRQNAHLRPRAAQGRSALPVATAVPSGGEGGR